MVNGVYLDYNGSGPIDPRVVEVMGEALADGAGNASSAHRFGRRQAAAVDNAREHVAALVGGYPANVLFTASATEANNLALRGVVEGAPVDRPRIVVSAVEHASVSQTVRQLDQQGTSETGHSARVGGGLGRSGGARVDHWIRRVAGVGNVSKQRDRRFEPRYRKFPSVRTRSARCSIATPRSPSVDCRSILTKRAQTSFQLAATKSVARLALGLLSGPGTVCGGYNRSSTAAGMKGAYGRAR